MASTANIQATTREYWNRTVQEECWMKILLTNLLIKRGQVTFPAGTAWKDTVETVTMESLAQNYGDTDPLTSSSKSLFIKPQWTRKRFQIPVKLTESELDEQTGGGDGVITPLPVRIVKNARKSAMLHLNGMIYGGGTDSGKAFQGLLSALNHDATYGTISRATTATNELWQGASIGQSFTDQDTNLAPNMYNVRQCIDAVSKFNPNPGDLVGICGKEIWRVLQSIVDPNRQTPPGELAKYGFTSLSVDGVPIYKDPWLSFNSSASTTKAYFFILHLPDWKLALSKKYRLGFMTDFTDQSIMTNGLPFDLARIKLAGNLICEAPNRSIWMSDMS